MFAVIIGEPISLSKYVCLTTMHTIPGEVLRHWCRQLGGLGLPGNPNIVAIVRAIFLHTGVNPDGDGQMMMELVAALAKKRARKKPAAAEGAAAGEEADVHDDLPGEELPEPNEHLEGAGQEVAFLLGMEFDAGAALGEEEGDEGLDARSARHENKGKGRGLGRGPT